VLPSQLLIDKNGNNGWGREGGEGEEEIKEEGIMEGGGGGEKDHEKKKKKNGKSTEQRINDTFPT
jgi:hypothetical protein